MPNFNPSHKTVLDELLLGIPLVQPGKMFGFPAYFVNKKLCLCLYEQGIGIKIPEQSAKRLLENDANAIPFQPLGKHKMREWVQINLTNSEDYRQYLPLFEQSIQHVLAQSESPGPSRQAR